MATKDYTKLTKYNLQGLSSPLDEMEIKINKNKKTFYVRVRLVADIELNNEVLPQQNCRANFTVISDNPGENNTKYNYIYDLLRNTKAENIVGNHIKGSYNGTEYDYVELKFRRPLFTGF